MFVIWLVLSVFNLVEAGFTLLKSFQFRTFFLKAVSRGESGVIRWPKVALLAPCKGIDLNLGENIRSWLAQQYPDFKVFFIVESKEDPAVPILQEFRGTELLFAGRTRDCGQKIHNLKYAIERVPEEFEAFAFIDSDCYVKPDWLSGLVSQLVEDPHGAVTGYRWFLCNTNDFGSQLRAVWNSGVLTLFDEEGKGNFAWGGSMAVFRQTFFDAHVLEFWKGSISDDYGLTNAIRARGNHVRFVPGTLAFTRDSIALQEFFSWATRQLLITRIYNPILWKLAFLYHTVWFLWVMIGVFYLPWFLPLFALTQIIQVIKAEIRLECVQRVLHGQQVGKRFYYWLLSPFVAFSNFFMMMQTLFTKTVRWRFVEYRLEGPNRLVLRHL